MILAVSMKEDAPMSFDLSFVETTSHSLHRSPEREDIGKRSVARREGEKKKREAASMMERERERKRKKERARGDSA